MEGSHFLKSHFLGFKYTEPQTWVAFPERAVERCRVCFWKWKVPPSCILCEKYLLWRCVSCLEEWCSVVKMVSIVSEFCHVQADIKNEQFRSIYLGKFRYPFSFPFPRAQYVRLEEEGAPESARRDPGRGMPGRGCSAPPPRRARSLGPGWSGPWMKWKMDEVFLIKKKFKFFRGKN